MSNILNYCRVLALVPLLTLTGCGSGEPGEDDMRNAIQAQFDRANEATRAAGGGQQIVLSEFKKLSCAKVNGSAVFACTVTLRVDGPWLNKAGGTTEMKFTRAELGWVVVE